MTNPYLTRSRYASASRTIEIDLIRADHRALLDPPRGTIGPITQLLFNPRQRTRCSASCLPASTFTKRGFHVFHRNCPLNKEDSHSPAGRTPQCRHGNPASTETNFGQVLHPPIHVARKPLNSARYAPPKQPPKMRNSKPLGWLTVLMRLWAFLALSLARQGLAGWSICIAP